MRLGGNTMKGVLRIGVDVWVCLTLIVASGYLLKISSNYPAGAGIYPRMLLLAVIGLSLVIAATAIFKEIKEPSEHAERNKDRDLLVVASVGLMVVLYGFGMHLLGLFLSTAIFYTVYARYLGCRNLKVILFSFSLFFAFLYVSFVSVLNVPIDVWPRIAV